MHEKKEEKKLTSASFAFTHTFRKTNTYFFYPSVHGKFGKMCKTQKKKHFISLQCPMLSVVVFPPLFLNLSLYVILDIPEVPAFKKRAQVFGR